MTPSVRSLEQSARSSAGLERVVRAGLVVYGAVHLLIAALAIQLVATGARTSSRGALAQIADDAWGLPIVSALVVGFGALALWQLIAALVGYRDLKGHRRTLMRLGAACRVVSYGYFALAILNLVIHRDSKTQSGPSPRGASADLLAQPLGRLFLGIAGLVIVGVGLGLVVFGARRAFLGQIDDKVLSTIHRRAVITLGVVGYVAKGLAFAVVGSLVALAALTDDPRKTGGLDRSLERLLGHHWGAAAIGVFGLGVGSFGLFLFARAHLFRRATLTA